MGHQTIVRKLLRKEKENQPMSGQMAPELLNSPSGTLHALCQCLNRLAMSEESTESMGSVSQNLARYTGNRGGTKGDDQETESK